MKALVTGGAGFLGSHVADALSDAGHSVVIFDRKESDFRREDQDIIIGDISDAASVSKALEGIDVVYHLAALADINVAMSRPREAIETNVLGTLNVLEACIAHSLERVVFSSSIYVYSGQGSFYRTSKQACEQMIQDYHEQHDLKYTILRYGSLYGPRADSGNAVRKMISTALEFGRIEYSGTGEEVREYIHIRDAALMSVQVLDDVYANSIIHITGRERMTTRAMIDMLDEILGGDLDIVLGDGNIPGHYRQTPYSYTPRLGRRLTPETFIDLGLGLLDCIQHADVKKNA